MKAATAFFLVISLGGPLGAQQPTMPSLGASVRAWTVGLPSLFAPLPQAQALGKGAPLQKNVESMQRVALDAGIVGFPAFKVSVEGREYVALLVTTGEWGPISQDFAYRTGEGELRSVFTKFYNGTVLAKLFVGGKGYFVSKEGDHYLVVRSHYEPLPEIVHYPMIEGRTVVSLFTTTTTSTCPGRCRAVRHPSPPLVSLVVAFEDGYVTAVGGKEAAIARGTHWLSRQNAAFANSGFEGRYEVREYAFFTMPKEDSHENVYDWAVKPGNNVIRDIRQRNKAAGVLIFSSSLLVNEAVRTPPGPINPDFEVAVAGGYSPNGLVDDDILAALHEMGGHFPGGDHNVESVNKPTDPYPSARDWVDCEAGVHGAVAVNPCGKFLELAEVYSGTSSFWNGKVTGVANVNDNVSAFRKVFPFLVGNHE